MRDQHLAIVVNYFPTVSETFIVNQIIGLKTAGFKVTLFSYHQTGTTQIHKTIIDHDLLNEVTYFIKPPKSKLKRFTKFLSWIWRHKSKINWKLLLNTLNFIKYGKAAYTLQLFYEAQWFLLPSKFDLIHAHFGMVGNRIANLKAYGLLPQDLPLVTTFHGYDLQPAKLDSYEETYRCLLKYADAFMVNTPYLKGLVDIINQKNKPIFVLPMGLDCHYFKRDNSKKESTNFELIFCGKLIPLKGPDTAITILNRLHEKGHTNTRLHLVGSGEMKGELKEMTKNYGVSEHVIFHDHLTQDELKRKYQNAYVFLLPGRLDPETKRAETQGLVIQEAQAMELPVVASDVGGIKYGMLPNESGFLIEPDNIESFTNAIEQLILDEALRSQFGKAGRKWVESTYDIKVLTEKLVTIYTTIFSTYAEDH